MAESSASLESYISHRIFNRIELRSPGSIAPFVALAAAMARICNLLQQRNQTKERNDHGDDDDNDYSVIFIVYIVFRTAIKRDGRTTDYMIY